MFRAEHVEPPGAGKDALAQPFTTRLDSLVRFQLFEERVTWHRRIGRGRRERKAMTRDDVSQEFGVSVCALRHYEAWVHRGDWSPCDACIIELFAKGF